MTMTPDHVIAKIAGSAAFLGSALLLPWFVTVIIGIFLLAFTRSYAIVIVGGVIMDIVFGSPQPALFGFSFIYTALFSILSLLAWQLESRVLE